MVSSRITSYNVCYTKLLRDKLVEGMRQHGVRSLGVEGADIGEWVLVDFGDVVVHVMRPQTRQFYNLEKLWGGAEAPGGALEI